jgi:hypothetical protein
MSVTVDNPQTESRDPLILDKFVSRNTEPPLLTTELDPFIRIYAPVLIRIGFQIGIRDPDHQDRFLVRDDLNSGNVTQQVDTYYRSDGMAGLGRNREDLVGIQNIAEQILAFEDCLSWRTACLDSNMVSFRKELADDNQWRLTGRASSPAGSCPTMMAPQEDQACTNHRSQHVTSPAQTIVVT